MPWLVSQVCRSRTVATALAVLPVDRTLHERAARAWRPTATHHLFRGSHSAYRAAAAGDRVIGAVKIDQPPGPISP